MSYFGCRLLCCMMRRSPVSSLIGWVTLFRKSYRLLLGMVSPEGLHLLSSLRGGSPYTLFLVLLLFYRGMGERIRLQVGRIRGRMTLEECEVAVVVDGVGGELKFVS